MEHEYEWGYNRNTMQYVGQCSCGKLLSSIDELAVTGMPDSGKVILGINLAGFRAWKKHTEEIGGNND